MTKTRSILILANSLGGLFLFRREVIKAFIDEGYSVTIAAPARGDNKFTWFVENGCTILEIPVDRRGTNPLSDLILVRRYMKLMKSIKPMVVLTYTIKPNVYGGIAARLLHIPQLANITGLGDAVENPGLLQKFTIFLYRIGLKKAKKVFYQNPSIRDFCQKHRIGKDGVLLPGSGVNLQWHTFQDYPPKDDKIKFNFIGRVMKDKGIEEFIAMTKAVTAKYPNTEFHIYGRCEERYEEQLKKWQDEGLVIWHGSVPDVRPYIKNSSCTIHPSYHEGMANVLLETCAAGRPVLASNISGCKEAIEDGVNGYVFNVKDTTDLIAKVEHFINLPYDKKVQMGKAAREKMEREFSRQIVLDLYLNAVKSVSK